MPSQSQFGAELQEPCPYCGVKAGVRCVTAAGSPVNQFPHGLRRDLASMNGRLPETFIPAEARSQIRRWQETQVPAARQMPEAGRRHDVITEHAIKMPSGAMQVRNSEPLTEKVYPLADWIAHGQENGGKVYRRRIIVVDDWEEVPAADSPRN